MHFCTLLSQGITNFATSVQIKVAQHKHFCSVHHSGDTDLFMKFSTLLTPTETHKAIILLL